MRRTFWAFFLALALIFSLAACSGRNNDVNNDNTGATGAGTGAGLGRTAARNAGTMYDDGGYYADGDGEVADYKFPNTSGRSAYNALQQGLDDAADGIRDTGRAVTGGVRSAGRAAEDMVSE